VRGLLVRLLCHPSSRNLVFVTLPTYGSSHLQPQPASIGLSERSPTLDRTKSYTNRKILPDPLSYTYLARRNNQSNPAHLKPPRPTTRPLSLSLSPKLHKATQKNAIPPNITSLAPSLLPPPPSPTYIRTFFAPFSVSPFPFTFPHSFLHQFPPLVSPHIS